MKKQTGLTLIELMIATIILTIMVSVAVPSMKSFLDRGNFSVIGPLFEKTVKLARTEAVQRTQTIRISPNSGNSDWSQGWSIYLVTGPSSSDVQLIRTFDAVPGDAVFTSATFDGSTNLDILPNGQAALIGSLTLNKAGCIGDIHTYNILLSGIVNRSVTPCP